MKVLFLIIIGILSSNISFADNMMQQIHREDGRYVVNDQFSVGSSFRTRYENKADFNFQDSEQDYFLTQFRLNLQWVISENLLVYVEGQDARSIGENEDGIPGVNDENPPSIYEDSFDLHQAYVQLKFDSTLPISIKAGRQKIARGAQRLISPLEWVNTARVVDGVVVTIGENDRTLDLFASRLVPVDPEGFNDWDDVANPLWNSGFHGLYYTDQLLIKESVFEAYWLLRYEDDADDQVHTLGSRIDSKILDPVDWNAELMVQFGDYRGLDHQALALHLEAGYSADCSYPSRLSMAYNFATGDDDPTDNDHGTFDNLYPLNHAYYGYMDLFSLQNIHNLELVSKTKIHDQLSVRIAYQSFWLAEPETDAWYNAAVGVIRQAESDVSSHVGQEIDLTFMWKAIPDRINVNLGYSHLFAGNYIEETQIASVKDADFVFIETKVIL